MKNKMIKIKTQWVKQKKNMWRQIERFGK
jgi:hypothetical protein